MKLNDYTRIMDLAGSGFTGFLLLLTVAFPQRILGSHRLGAQFAIALVLYAAAAWKLRRMRHSLTTVVLRTVTVVALYAFLFAAIADLQHVLVRGWMDDALLAFERGVAGLDTSVYLQSFVNPVLTEMMMFAYVIYVPMLAGTALLCYRSAGPRAAYDYLFHLSLVNIGCNLGFILFPVASPLYHQPQLYSVPLDGWFFTWCGEWIRHHAHYAGGSLPSPHCAAATIMLVMLCRHVRRAFYAAMPVFHRQVFFNLQKARESVQPAWTCSIQKAKTHLGFNPRLTLDEGMRSTFRWYRENGWLN